MAKQQFTYTQQSGSGSAYTTSYASLANNLSAALLACGMTLTSDSGQTTSFAASDAGGIKYQVYKFSDSLQASAPVYIRIDYYCQSAPAYTGATPQPVALGIQVGTSTDGAGNINGAQYSPHCYLTSNNSNTSENQFGYVSGASNRICAAIGEGPDVQNTIFFNVERTKDTSGNDTNEGIIVQIIGPWYSAGSTYIYPGPPGLPGQPGGSGTTGVVINMVIPFVGTVSVHNTSLITAVNTGKASMAVGTNVGVLAVVPFCFRPFNPGYGMQLYYGSDYPVYSSQAITMTDGASHTYLALQQNTCFWINPPSQAAFILMRYE